MALGIEKGQRVGMWAPNRAEWTLMQFATSKIGAILVNINPSYRLSEVRYALRQSGCTWLVIAPEFKTSDYTGMMHELAPELGEPPGRARREGPARPARRHPARRGALAGHARLGRAAGEGGGGQRRGPGGPAARAGVRRAINIQYTSGTTGYPKGATLSHHNILNDGYFTTELLGFTDRDRLLIPVPLYHCFGMVMGDLGCVTTGPP